MEQNLITRINEVAKAMQEFDDALEVSEKTVFIHKVTGDEKDLAGKSFEYFIENGINPLDYEKKVVTNDPKSRLVDLLTGDPDAEITKSDFEGLEYLYKTVPKLTKEFQFAAEKKQLTNKVNNAKPEDREAARRKRCQLYIDYGVEPRSTFSDIELYNQMKKKQ